MFPTTPALGIDRDEEPLVPKQVQLKANDIILLVSDGIIEAWAPDGEEFGEERMLAVVQRERERPAAEIIQALMDAVRAHSGTNVLQDDMTAVVIKH